MTTSPVLTALRNATARSHAALEQHLAVASDGATRTDYLHYLEDMHGWLRAFEQALWDAEWPNELQAPARAGKLAWIEQDLNSAGMSRSEIGALPASVFAPDLSSEASRFGLAYVIEGAQLGTKQLRQRLDQALDGWEPRWLEGYGEQNGERWRGFLHALAGHVHTPQEISAACDAAAAGFDSLAGWFEQRRGERAELAMVK
ncbi:biliverdin-producing heme oxygenase [Pseudoduganella sp. GCM10020061]|uniref:biliverdin-producing heme oxygenase n=1 Tax=Pseudoduganella sp. GCM10020061 TaxID=3317345 RepID=UPI00364569A6